MAFTISEPELLKILSPFGYPKIPLFFELDDIKETALAEALETYFKWFPAEEERQYPLPLGRFEVPIPTDIDGTIYGIVDARDISSFSYNASNSSAWGFARNVVSVRGNTYGDDYRRTQQNLLRGALQKTVDNTFKSFRVRFDRSKKIVWGISNKTAELSIRWAYATESWDDIYYERKGEARDLARAMVADKLLGLHERFDIDTGVNINLDQIRELRDKKDAILETWAGAGVVVALPC